eukprot:TRINITY_DN747_c1_g1_i1.p1 TRINITY_DN747_c1_g1~~TRINITY_DN747_c1_g1_i1.p1  ORF type:complete len:297 (-),score=41.58 TRINITY_DN747_c1_g1_i1:101-991(-)
MKHYCRSSSEKIPSSMTAPSTPTTPTPRRRSPFDSLPIELLVAIFWHLDGVSLARASTVCRVWDEVISGQVYLKPPVVEGRYFPPSRKDSYGLWKNATLKCLAKRALTSNSLPSENICWRDEYRRQYRSLCNRCCACGKQTLLNWNVYACRLYSLCAECSKLVLLRKNVVENRYDLSSKALKRIPQRQFCSTAKKAKSGFLIWDVWHLIHQLNESSVTTAQKRDDARLRAKRQRINRSSKQRMTWLKQAEEQMVAAGIPQERACRYALEALNRGDDATVTPHLIKEYLARDRFLFS